MCLCRTLPSWTSPRPPEGPQITAPCLPLSGPANKRSTPASLRVNNILFFPTTPLHSTPPILVTPSHSPRTRRFVFPLYFQSVSGLCPPWVSTILFRKWAVCSPTHFQLCSTFHLTLVHRQISLRSCAAGLAPSSTRFWILGLAGSSSPVIGPLGQQRGVSQRNLGPLPGLGSPGGLLTHTHPSSAHLSK